MLGELSFVIIREIIKRIIEYESIDNLRFLNKKLNSLITNDRICQKYYFSLRYPKIKWLSDSKDLGYLMKLLNFKKYSKYLELKFTSNKEELLFVRPHDDSFIIITKYYSKRKFYLSDEKMIPFIQYIIDNDLENFKDIFLSKGFFHLNFKFPQKDKRIYFCCDPHFSWIPYSPLKKRIKSNILLYTEIFNHNILQIINEL